MTRERFEREKMYQLTMYTVRKLLTEGLITEEEYCQIDTIFKAKYCPLFVDLFTENR